VKAIGIRAAVFCSLLNCLPIFSCGAEQNPKDLIQKFERRYRSARTLEALFVERYIDNGKEVRKLDGHHTWVRALAFSADGNTLISGSLDATARLWGSK